eukprot:3365666-Rhodomonas_salina.1
MAAEDFASMDDAMGNMLTQHPFAISLAFIAALFLFKKLMERSVPVVDVPCENDAEKSDTFTGTKKLTMADATPR